MESRQGEATLHQSISKATLTVSTAMSLMPPLLLKGETGFTRTKEPFSVAAVFVLIDDAAPKSALPLPLPLSDLSLYGKQKVGGVRRIEIFCS